MSASVFLADSLGHAVVGGEVSLLDSEAHHASTVVRMAVGEPISVVDGRGRRVDGTVAELARGEVVVAVTAIIDEPAPQPRIVVVQALAKGDRGERAVETLTEVGVDVIVPWSAAHSVSQWRDDKAQRGADKWRSVAQAAAKQSRRSFIPDVSALCSTADLRSICEGALVLVLDERSSEPIGQIEIPPTGDVVIVVGPEGGLSESERSTFASWGARAVRLGPSILRTSTAGTVAAGIALSATDRWRLARMQP